MTVEGGWIRSFGNWREDRWQRWSEEQTRRRPRCVLLVMPTAPSSCFDACAASPLLKVSLCSRKSNALTLSSREPNRSVESCRRLSVFSGEPESPFEHSLLQSQEHGTTTFFGEPVVVERVKMFAVSACFWPKVLERRCGPLTKSPISNFEGFGSPDTRQIRTCRDPVNSRESHV